MKEFNIINFIDNFVYKNWRYIDTKVKVTKIEINIEDENDNEFLQEELFYKDIVYEY
jgi:hypothetical protein